jgi:hypothetical protein
MATVMQPASSAENGAGYGSIASVRHTLARISLMVLPHAKALFTLPPGVDFSVCCGATAHTIPTVSAGSRLLQAGDAGVSQLCERGHQRSDIRQQPLVDAAPIQLHRLQVHCNTQQAVL